MFGTLRYSPQKDDTEFIGISSSDVLDDHAPGKPACDRCRLKKQRCSGQNDGCDRCKRTLSVCIYTSSGKGRAARRATAPHGSRSNQRGGLKDTGSVRRPEQQVSPIPQQHRQDARETDEIGDLLSPLNTAAAGLDDDFAIADRLLHDLQPDYNCHDLDNQSDTGTFPNVTGVGDLDLSQYHHNNSVLTALAQSMSSDLNTFSEAPASPAFSIESFLASPALTSRQPCFDKTSSRPESFNLSTLARTQDGPETSLSNGSKGLSPPDDSPTRCQCLWTIEVSLEELEKKKHIVDPAALDSILASQKKALADSYSVLECSTCVTRSEYVLLLGVTTERLVTLCESAVSLYLEEVQRRSSSRTTTDRKYQSRTSSGQSIKFFLGRYEIESLEEWSSLMRVLLVLQMQNLLALLAGVKKAAVSGANVTRLPMVQATERRIGALIQKLRQPEPYCR